MKRGILLGLVVTCVLAAGVVLGYGPLVRRQLASRLQAWGRLHGRRVTWKALEVSWRGIRIRGLAIRDRASQWCPLAEVDSIWIPARPWKLLVGMRPARAVVSGGRFCLERGPKGDNFSDLLRTRGGRRGHRRIQLTLVSGSLRVADSRRGLTIQAGDLAAEWRSGSGLEVVAREVHGRWHGLEGAARELRVWTKGRRWAGLLVEGGRLALLRRLVLTGIQGRSEPAADGRISLAFRGSYGGLDVPLWEWDGWIAPRARRASLDFTVQRFELSRLSEVLDRTRWGKALVDRGRAWAAMDAHVEREGANWRFHGSAHLAGLAISDPRLARQVVRGLGFDLRLEGTYDGRRDQLSVPRAVIERRGVRAFVALSVQRLTGRPRVRLGLRIPRTDCGRLLAALPDALVPELRKMRFGGPVRLSLQTDVDFGYLTEETVSLDTRIDWRHCRVLSAPWELSAERLERSFTHSARDGHIVTRFVVGPSNPDYVPLDDISRHVVNAILTTEDSRFFEHHGFIRREFRRALARNIIARRFRYGASSISMQLVKNVLLGREKTLSRKLQELVLTAYLERHLSKERILEIYLNVIEFGPGIYGIGRAARHFFGKPAALVEPQEAAYLSTVLPSPKKRYIHYCRGRLGRKWRAWVDRILRLMYERHRLTADELEHALATPVVFSREEFSSYARCKARIRHYLRGGS